MESKSSAHLCLLLAVLFTPLPAAPPLSPISTLRQAPTSDRTFTARGSVILLPGGLPGAPKVFYMQDLSGGISVEPVTAAELDYGQVVEVTGTIHHTGDNEPELTAESLRIVANGQTVRPSRVTNKDILEGAHAGSLSIIRATVAGHSIGSDRDIIVFENPSGDPSLQQARAYVRRPVGQPSVVASLAQPGALVEVTGIIVPTTSNGTYQLRLRNTGDLVLITAPSFFASQAFRLSAAVLLGVLLLGLLWIVTLRRAIARQTAEIRGLLERAEEVSRLKSELLANLSHEVRTPIHGILGMLSLLFETDLSGSQRECVNVAHQSANHLLALLNDMLDCSRIEAGRLELHPEPFCPTALIHSVAASARVLAIGKGLDLNVRLQDLPPQLSGDVTRLRQVLWNLVSNAVKFTEHGHVTIAAEINDRLPSAVRVRFAVTDTGIGIPLEKQSLIFESFRQADGSISRRFGGSGLGLAIASNIVRHMGGEISVISSEGHGATFSFIVELPLADAPAPTPENPEPALPQAALRILVAEDNLVNQRLITALLERDSHHVTLVDSGLAALDAVHSTTFDVILMDIQMPGMDGVTATAQLRAQGCLTPVFALTAHVMPGDRERFLAAGMDDVLPKPFTLSSLRALLRSTPSPR